MPLPWTFALNALMPADDLDGRRAAIHVRLYTDPWAGGVVVLGELAEQPGDFAAQVDPVLRRVDARIADSSRLRVVLYRPAAHEAFTEFARPSTARTALPVATWPSARRPTLPGADATVVIRCGPVVDVWSPGDYTARTVAGRERTRATSLA